jgi:phage terminase large subunit-like protein
LTSPKSKADIIRENALNDLEAFIRLVHPQRVLGDVHKELIRWWTRSDAKSHQLVLLPRDHGKSALVAYRVAWEITRNPAVRVLYISSTANLAIKQLKFIKDILTSDNYRRYWPEMVNADEFQREKWSETEIAVDHPLRKAEVIRDPTVFTAGLTTNVVGLHCDIAVLDDVVTNETAYTEEGRNKVKTQYSLLSSIEGAEAREWVVGTRYFVEDLYNDMLGMRVELFDEFGEVIDDEPLYEVFERQVESVGDGTGEYLWPRQQRYDGKWFGFNAEVLAKKRAQYLDKTQFRAQYYNDPNDPSESVIQNFQYYDRNQLIQSNGEWYIQNRRLNLFAAIDFAFSESKRADYTAIVVIGVDGDKNYYIMDIDRFKSGIIHEYFARILRLHQKWGFRKIRADASVAQEVIVKSLKEDYIRKHNLALAIDDYKPTKHEGTKAERTNAVLQPRYQNHQIWHYRGGYCQTLEEELVMKYPPHDDLKDTLAMAIDSSVAPTNYGKGGPQYSNQLRQQFLQDITHKRFGGIG